ncbi:uncharacterized protein MELLADRAFT_104600 [Melampsora larici-populina 98AG31]|uniref:Uncharacterized protein n=1 Tax=Melampsora larici-populina (strain 98AG31 / pathotype 3-4-7) TaxID=747676 RepID=F4RF92_MELLP|nr:uncharacterized protein MELLADRAFT_104600 [Melampsora larici-populina 98AG31]EGG08974.1 hypothetical protein MELLADRAFT_104600 [Melampsora larici-populina 98AG31]
MTSYPLMMSATLPVTENAIAVTQGFLRWHRTAAELMITDSDGHTVPHPITALGYVSPKDALKCSHSYSLNGRFGHDIETDAAFVQHCSSSQVDIGVFRETYVILAGRATVNGICRSASVLFVARDDAFLPWNMIITATHEYRDPVRQQTSDFAIDYHFEHQTPLPYEWKTFIPGLTMWMHGNLVGRDEETRRFIVTVTDYSIVDCDGPK